MREKRKVIDTHVQRNSDSVNRIRRIQGQLKSLARLLENDAGSCEEQLIRARTIENAVSSLMNHLIVSHVTSDLQLDKPDDSTTAGKELGRLLKLLKN
jgi:DNA-binding FrmR family transcriptional regulator